MKTTFYKLQGTGNDFVAFDFRNSGIEVSELKKLTPFLCDRRFGVGADGVLAILPSNTPQSAYAMLYLNADGSDAGMCGNGGRCIALLASHLGIQKKHSFSVHQRLYHAEVEGNNVRLHFPAEPEIIATPDSEFGTIEIVNTGTEHICIKFDDETRLSDLTYLKEMGKKLRFDPRFAPKGTNVNFYYPLEKDAIKLLTYERGVEDFTLSCGTGSLAAAICHGKTTNQNSIRVFNTGGEVTCTFKNSDNPNIFNELTMKGQAEIVFQGSIALN